MAKRALDIPVLSQPASFFPPLSSSKNSHGMRGANRIRVTVHQQNRALDGGDLSAPILVFAKQLTELNKQNRPIVGIGSNLGVGLVLAFGNCRLEFIHWFTSPPQEPKKPARVFVNGFLEHSQDEHSGVGQITMENWRRRG